jgi:SPP1 family predicted phage head-tail adaptor
MEIGQMTERITILKPKQQSGAVVDLDDNNKWDTYRNAWAKVEYLKGQEYYAAMAVNAETSIRFIIWYCKDIDATMAIKYQGHIYNINSVYPLDSTRTWFIILAKEVIVSE